MATGVAPKSRSIFAPATARERAENFESYWTHLRTTNGRLLEAERALAEKQRILTGFRERPVRTRRTLVPPEQFYRNHVTMRDDPRRLDRTTLLLTFLYKFARHEWVGISAAWDATPTFVDSRRLSDQISRYHLAEEFCHMRLFGEMFATFRLDAVEWVPLASWVKRAYGVFARLPSSLMAPAAFVSELMGLTVYVHVDQILDELLGDAPEVRQRIRELLYAIAVDELSHVGLRRNYLGGVGCRVARRLVRPMFSLFFRGMPEAKLLFDLRRMAREAEAFDYGTIPPAIRRGAWIPSYCRGLLDPA